MKTAEGMETYGSFQIGHERRFAVNLFMSLRGSAEVSLDSVITAELVKWKGGQRQDIALIHCSYLQLGDNVKTITKGLFKRLNLNH